MTAKHTLAMTFAGGIGALAVAVLISDLYINTPSLSLESDRIDFGKVTAGERIEKTVQVSNKGSAPLSIESIAVSCGCLTGQLSKAKLLPGEKADLVLTLTETSPHPRKATRLVLNSNDPARPLQEIVATSICRPRTVKLGRHTIDLGRVSRGDLPLVQRVPVLTPLGDHEVAAELRSGDAKSISVKMEGIGTNDASTMSLVIEVGKNCNSGITIWEVDVGKRSGSERDTLKLSCNVLGDYYASPSYLVINRREKSTHVSIIDLHRRSNDAPIEPETISISGNLSQWVKASTDLGRLRVEFSPKPTAKAKSLRALERRLLGSISVNTANTNETLSIPLEVWP